jgi:hypothetical protein
MVGMDGIEPLKGPGRPNIDDRIAPAGEEQVSLFRKVQVQNTFLVSTNRENKVVVLKRPRYNVSSLETGENAILVYHKR